MSIFAPKYYKDFKCIADKCCHSCCIGWEIDVDEEALCRYEALGDEGADIIKSIDMSTDTPHFRLLSDERCPHLDSHGLCRIITEHGEDYLCDICREHPRFYNFPKGRCEVGLGAACEEAARLILTTESYSETEELFGEADIDEGGCDFDAAAERARIYEVLSDGSLSYNARLLEISEKYAVSARSLSDEKWHKLISELEYLDAGSRDIFLNYSSDVSSEIESYSERALAYFIYRHTGSAESPEQLRLSLGLAFFLERLFSSCMAGIDELTLDCAVLLLRRISEEIEYSEENTERIKFEFI